MSNIFIHDIHERNRSMMNLTKMINAYHLLTQILLLDVPGEIVELGCYRGLTALLFQKTLLEYRSNKKIHLYDSFQGLPEKSEKDLVDSSDGMRLCDYKDNHRVGKGWFKASKNELLTLFSEYNAAAPTVHEGWFHETLPNKLPTQIAFAHIDADFYQSTLDALEAVYPRVPKGGIILLDDYCDPDITGRQSALPGVKRACDQFFQDKPEKVENLIAGKFEYHAYIRKA